MSEYNGYKNRSTWAVNLNLSNDEVAYHAYQACKTEGEIYDVWLDLFEPNHDSVDLFEVDFKHLLENIIENKAQV